GVDAEPYRLPGIVLDNDGDAVGNAAGADEWVGRRLLAAKGFHALMEIVIADKAIDTEVAAAPEGAAEIRANVAERLILERAVGAGIGRDAGRKVLILQTALRKQAAAGITFPEQAAYVIHTHERFQRMRLHAVIGEPRVERVTGKPIQVLARAAHAV